MVCGQQVAVAESYRGRIKMKSLLSLEDIVMRRVFVSLTGALFVAFAASALQADIESDLAAHWKLDETTDGPVVNQVGPDGANEGASIGQPGKIGTAYSFDRDQAQYVDTNLNDIIPATGDFSLFAWINTTSHGNPAANTGYIFSNFVPNTGGRSALQVRLGRLGFFVNNSVLITTANVNNGKWRHVGVIRQSGDFTLWVDGKEIGVISGEIHVNAAMGTGTNWRIGGPHANPPRSERHFDGLIDDVRVYHRALTEGAVKELSQF